MIFQRLETYLTAATYAQSNEFETALDIINTKPNDKSALKGGLQMTKNSEKKKTNKYLVPALGYGAISLSLYAALLLNEGKVTETFTLGGWFTVLPVGCALLFSFIHGAFASNLLSALGLEAKK